MKFRRPRSLNGLILVGFGLVAAPLLLAIIWALFSLDRLAEQSEQLVVTGVTAAEQNRLLAEQVGSFERVSRQHAVLQSADSRELLRQDFASLQARLDTMAPLTTAADAAELARQIRLTAEAIVNTLLQPATNPANTEQALGQFAPLRQNVTRLTTLLSSQIERELAELQDNIQDAQQISAWQTAALVPGTIVLVLFFTLLVARPIRQIDQAINQLGQSGFSKPIRISGPTDLEELGRQLDWLRLRLLELAQEKNRFLRHMSHELKTPLANIREGTELLLDGTVGDLQAPQREVTDILRLNGLKLQQLIENLLSFSAWQTKNEVLTRSDFPIRALAVAVAKAQRLALKAGQIQLRLQVDDEIINADRDKIRTVLDNLLSNAIKFTPKGGIITIRGVRSDQHFILEFGDTGPGIPEEERPRIFDAFFQGKREQGGQVAGTGIGLSVVLECIQAHDGSVELLDSDEFTGAYFRIHIPQSQAAAQPRIAANA
jgi:two-component system, NtrC family, sensor histidine kinase GlrK